MQQFSLLPQAIITSFWLNRGLILALVKREVIGRYRGSFMGILWSFFYPVVMLSVYTFVFSVVFKARWSGAAPESKTEFALVLFAGLMFFNLFSECISRAPSLILTNVNYVKKVIFPLEILPIVSLGSALFHLLISLFVWLSFDLIFFGIPPITILQLPFIILPVALLILGISWFLASLGVYLRDVAQVIGVVTTMLMFLSPIFYPTAAIPEKYRPFMQISPLTFAIEQARGAMIWGKSFEWIGWGIYTGVSMIVVWFGFVWFQKTRKGFADVL